MPIRLYPRQILTTNLTLIGCFVPLAIAARQTVCAFSRALLFKLELRLETGSAGAPVNQLTDCYPIARIK